MAGRAAGCPEDRAVSLRTLASRLLPGLGLALGGCVTATVDEIVFSGPSTDPRNSAVVILGRRHVSDYETEPGFVECVARHIGRAETGITVISEAGFMNALYPWFEPRTAPLRTADLERLLRIAPVRERLADMRAEYMVWIDGNTTRTDGAGSMTCGIGPGGAGCFGFGTWSNDSDYEAVIWDFTDRRELGRMSATASGQSYMPALLVPIPLIAPVRDTACSGLGEQLLRFLDGRGVMP